MSNERNQLGVAVGRIVHYRAEGEHPSAKPRAALIVAVFDSEDYDTPQIVNLYVFGRTAAEAAETHENILHASDAGYGLKGMLPECWFWPPKAFIPYNPLAREPAAT